MGLSKWLREENSITRIRGWRWCRNNQCITNPIDLRSASWWLIKPWRCDRWLYHPTHASATLLSLKFYIFRSKLLLNRGSHWMLRCPLWLDGNPPIWFDHYSRLMLVHLSIYEDRASPGHFLLRERHGDCLTPELMIDNLLLLSRVLFNFESFLQFLESEILKGGPFGCLQLWELVVLSSCSQ